MKKAKSTWKPFTARLNGRTVYDFNCDSYIPIEAGDLEMIKTRWGDILDIQDVTPDQAVEESGVVEADITNPVVPQSDGSNS